MPYEKNRNFNVFIVIESTKNVGRGINVGVTEVGKKKYVGSVETKVQGC